MAKSVGRRPHGGRRMIHPPAVAFATPKSRLSVNALRVYACLLRHVHRGFELPVGAYARAELSYSSIDEYLEAEDELAAEIADLEKPGPPRIEFVESWEGFWSVLFEFESDGESRCYHHG